MNYVKKGPISKGQIKCFHCRSITRTKDGTWQDIANQQVFVCKPCDHATVAKTPVPAVTAR